MRLLLLGGPYFLGRAIADATLAHGHELTFFNRGRTNASLYPQVERLVGDRDGDLRALRGRTWDAVVDTCGYVPHVVRASVEALTESGLYCFVSSISAYADLTGTVDEESPLAALGDDPVDTVTPGYSNYGALKALCEDAVRTGFGERALVVRPGLIVGPHDPTGRFTYWPHRVARGGRILAPGPHEREVQFVDVRDLGEWILGLCERGIAGTLNATNDGVSWEALLESCRRVTGSECQIAWVTDEFLLANDVGEWIELPLWIADGDSGPSGRTVVDRALAAGLRFRPLDETVQRTLDEARPTETAGLQPQRERALLAAWDER